MTRTLLVLLAAGIAAGQPLPSFDRLGVTEVFQGKPVPPRLTTAFARSFRTVIREAAKQGPNFAGWFTIAHWGCGSGCIQMAVIDQKTGAVYKGPFTVLDFGAPRRFADGSDASNVGFEPLAFRKDSRLLAVRGCPEENQNRCALFYYEWTGQSFRLLRPVTAVAGSE
ncbi:MAG TPA: hypothetical protein VKX49_31870 [Bryobacteraceae bacterium]|nr:hypothetical protein [Bryobacteraceae bacterium]